MASSPLLSIFLLLFSNLFHTNSYGKNQLNYAAYLIKFKRKSDQIWNIKLDEIEPYFWNIRKPRYRMRNGWKKHIYNEIDNLKRKKILIQYLHTVDALNTVPILNTDTKKMKAKHWKNGKMNKNIMHFLKEKKTNKNTLNNNRKHGLVPQ